MTEVDFWARAERTETCWIWRGNRIKKRGYGIVKKPNGRRHAAHRVAWEFANGPIPDGLFVCHKCDNPSCVRPGHLFLGTAKDNTEDMLNKGRWRKPSTANRLRGDDHPTRKHPEQLRRGDESWSRNNKHRLARGEHHGMSKLTEDHVRVIRYLRKNTTLTRKDVGVLFGISWYTVQDVDERRSWAHVVD